MIKNETLIRSKAITANRRGIGEVAEPKAKLKNKS